jgi:hypothetical protein
MTSQIRPIAWCLFILVACSLVAFAVYRRDAHLAFALGREAGAETMAATSFFPQAFMAGTAAFFVILLIAAWQAKVRLSALRVLFVGFMAFGCSTATHIGWVLVGKPAGCYFDGFAERVAAIGIESTAVAWMEQLGTNQTLNPTGLESVDVAPEGVPKSLLPVFGKMGTPKVTIYYDKTGKKVKSVDLQLGLAEIVRPVKFGLAIVEDADAEVRTLPGIYSGRSCGKRLMAYWGCD